MSAVQFRVVSVLLLYAEQQKTPVPPFPTPSQQRAPTGPSSPYNCSLAGSLARCSPTLNTPERSTQSHSALFFPRHA